LNQRPGSDVGDSIVQLVSHVPFLPFIIAWLITAVIHILTGQGTVAAITSAGIVAPMIGAFDLNPALMLLAVACGSNTVTLMYDDGFLLFKESFGISMKDTFKSWRLLELINPVVGPGMVMLISQFIGCWVAKLSRIVRELIFIPWPAGKFSTRRPGRMSAAAVTPVMHDRNSTEKVITSSMLNVDMKNSSGNILLEAADLNRLGSRIWRHKTRDLFCLSR